MADQRDKFFEDNPYWDETEHTKRQDNNVLVSENRSKDTSNPELSTKTVPDGESQQDVSDLPYDDVTVPNVKVVQEDNNLLFIIGNESFRMIRVEGGSFTMGEENPEAKKIKTVFMDERPAHKVTLPSFYICETMVTQELWKAVFPNADVNIKRGRENLPKVKVSWDDCWLFANRLTKITGHNFRLPTEAEWEFAARGGVHSKGFKFAGNDNISFVAWYNNTKKPIQPVRKLKTNELGLYDMSGNVSEWCADWYDKDYYANSAENNPQGPESGQYRVIRGGSVFSTADGCRTTLRMFLAPNKREAGVGLRLVL